MTKEEFLALASKKWEELENKREESGSFFDYEQGFDDLWVEFGRLTLEGSLGEIPKDRRKKKSP
jgi:hypothetical protein